MEPTVNKRQRKPKGQSRMDNPEEDKQSNKKNTTQYVLDTTIRITNTNNVNET